VEYKVGSVTIIVDGVWLYAAIITPISVIVIAIITVLSIIIGAIVAPVIASVLDVTCTFGVVLLA
jgi:hypothetical protein